MTTTEPAPATNPYVGPRTFAREQGRFFFGRDHEARDLLARVVSERLLLFYAQSGAGKSSLLNTRLIPGLQGEGFAVLPVGRVSGEMPPGAVQVDDIYVFNLLRSLDQGEGEPQRFSHLSLGQFLARLTTEDGEHWQYEPQATQATQAPPVPQVAQIAQVAPVAQAPRAPQTPQVADTSGAQPYVLIIDQFEEIITSHPARWQEREDFFRQLDQAMREDPNLWVVLTLREDYVAALDPYAPLMADRLRARFYMERMDVAAALEAVREPARMAGQPFAPGVAEKLVDDLRQVRVPGQDATVAGQYVEPVQLQVVCYQLWERLHRAAGKAPAAVGGQIAPAAVDGQTITEADLAQAGNVNQALAQYYADTLVAVLADPKVVAAQVNERALRTWFDKELLTETGIRNTIFRNEASQLTGSMPNVAVDALTQRFLLRTELRGGGAWVELVHDRFVGPIVNANRKWRAEHFSPLTQAAEAWQAGGKDAHWLYRGQQLEEAEREAATAQRGALSPAELEFIQASREGQRRWRTQTIVFGLVALLAVVSVFFVQLTREARTLRESQISQTSTIVDLQQKIKDLQARNAQWMTYEQEVGSYVQAQSTETARLVQEQAAQLQTIGSLRSIVESSLATQGVPSREATRAPYSHTPTASAVPRGYGTPQLPNPPSVPQMPTAVAVPQVGSLPTAPSQGPRSGGEAPGAPGSAWQACPDAASSTLRVGDMAKIASGPANRIRSKAGSEGVVIGTAPADSLLEVLSGPECADGMVWWNVLLGKAGLSGWTSEGSREERWLTFVPSGTVNSRP